MKEIRAKWDKVTLNTLGKKFYNKHTRFKILIISTIPILAKKSCRKEANWESISIPILYYPTLTQ